MSALWCENCGESVSSDYVAADRTGHKLCIECEPRPRGKYKPTAAEVERSDMQDDKIAAFRREI